ncbi:EF hand [Roseimaritima multifibrata]|uniref:EF hand n=1 Tax=Roseimaritima multifibrata TaxID=1930274 RepID=A0A517MBR9_9BACT|nr:proprotein convertase P-domain-containing protein [Roseimaritima multifibrata]QDS92322.1 EF hand [Roseimaritima multifibrata]
MSFLHAASIPFGRVCRFAAILPMTIATVCLTSGQASAQSGLRESLERLDRNQNGEIDPEEITSMARPFLERIAKSKRLSLNRSNDIEEFQEAARIYHAMANGMARNEIDLERDSTVVPFGSRSGETVIPEFGLAEVKYPYTEEDLRLAERAIRRSDRNDDGVLDRKEAAAGEWRQRDPFEADLNKDDRLSRLELAQRYARRRLLDNASSELVRRSARVGNGIRRAADSSRDSDNDDSRGRRRRGDIRSYLVWSVMERFDADRNGRLEAEEAASLGVPLSQMDVDRDGVVDRRELQEYLEERQDEAGAEIGNLPGWFFELDADRDQQVAMSEFTKEWTAEKLEEFNSYDRNLDGLLTAEEVQMSRAGVGGTYRNEAAEVLAPRKTIVSEIEVDEDYLIDDLNLRLSITHSNVDSLDGYLTGPDGQRVELFTEIGGSGNHFDDTVFDDQADTPIVKGRPPYEGSFHPEARTKRQPSLSHFEGKSIKGVWQLVIRGTRGDRFGMLNGWSLIVKPRDEMLDAKPIEVAEEE